MSRLYIEAPEQPLFFVEAQGLRLFYPEYFGQDKAQKT
jgi:hypothetical protein